MNQEYAYWLTFAHIPRISNKVKNDIIIGFLGEGLSIIDFYNSDIDVLKNKYNLGQSELALIEESKKELPNNEQLAEILLEKGFDIIPIISEEYSPVLKNNLKRTYSPPVIYTRGNKQILKEKSIAIVGSREASEISLTFADNIAKDASKKFKVVVSGFAKGVDKQALDSSIKYIGQSIIVLPQGIMTFGTGFKTYSSEISEGNVLVLSTFFPKAPWNVKLAMARNSIIYGLVDEIYVAESSDTGGTWSGVIDGLRKGRKIFVRTPGENEKNANNLLIEKGAVPVDMCGNICEHKKNENTVSNEKTEDVKTGKSIESEIIKLLETGEFTAAEIQKKLNSDWTVKKINTFLKSLQYVKITKKKPVRFTLSNAEQLSIFNK